MANIRLAEATDANAVYALAQSFATSFVVEEQAFRHSFSELLAATDAYLAVAERHNQVVGYVLGFDHAAFHANDRAAYIASLKRILTLPRAEHILPGHGPVALGRGWRLVEMAYDEAMMSWR